MKAIFQFLDTRSLKREFSKLFVPEEVAFEKRTEGHESDTQHFRWELYGRGRRAQWI